MINYKKLLEQWSKENNKVIIEWSMIQEFFDICDYNKLAKIIQILEEENILKEYGSKKNGRRPNLSLKYKIILEKKDYSEYINEIDYDLAPQIDKRYYKQHLSTYEKDREDILAISDYIKNNKHLLETKISINERSFEVFKREKRIKGKGMTSILRNLGLDEDLFNYYETCEPIAYYSINKEQPQNVLIIENQDTFYSIRKYIKNISSNVLGIDISTVIYGGGNGRLPSMNEMEEYTEDYISNPNNTFYYFGDIDYAGISIYESYRERTKDKIEWIPFNTGYEYIIDKVVKNNTLKADIGALPDTKAGQKDNRKGIFMDYFNNEYQDKIENILQNRKYIPQEALNFNDLISYKKESK